MAQQAAPRGRAELAARRQQLLARAAQQRLELALWAPPLVRPWHWLARSLPWLGLALGAVQMARRLRRR